ncbi:MAG: bifunctional glutamate N-acetyltransferase/amino-acid acetyltransferase ArgJ [bacterium]|nr:bifunctional glutamate N-acetyltransferase/amino-acid acetyltransferase ArgJ [bacterium]MDT8366610.1 bifunctional glutamate N-acetyltransferase/amino-acid acetyltransferase ArgJ [bacterium]
MLKVNGFSAGAVSADIRNKGNGRLDLGLIVADSDATTAAVFTRNAVVAPPVEICRERVGRKGSARAVLVNSGNANCMTLSGGRADALRLSERVARLLDIPEESVLPCSTGVIGQRLPMDRMEAALDPLVRELSPEGLELVSQAILTTDSVTKTVVQEVTLKNGKARIVGMAKGSGMIAPDMATMLAFILTDAGVGKSDLSQVLADAVADTFNSITVDGDMSTNDTVILMASGKGQEVKRADDLAVFGEAVHKVCETLADMIVGDGEGATKVVNIKVTGAADNGEAKMAARAIAESLLVKTAFAAADPNWGRIAAAAGYSGAAVDMAKISLFIGEVKVLEGGEIVPGYDEAEAVKVMKLDRYEITLGIGDGEGRATMKTCDLTEEYVRINCEYRT